MSLAQERGIRQNRANGQLIHFLGYEGRVIGLAPWMELGRHPSGVDREPGAPPAPCRCGRDRGGD